MPTQLQISELPEWSLLRAKFGEWNADRYGVVEPCAGEQGCGGAVPRCSLRPEPRRSKQTVSKAELNILDVMGAQSDQRPTTVVAWPLASFV